MGPETAAQLWPGGWVIPSKGQLRVALAYHPKPRTAWLGRVDGFDLSPFNQLAPTSRRILAGDRQLTLRSEPQTLFEFDFESGGPYEDRQTSITLTTTGGRVNGVVQWIRLQMDAEGVYENRPAPGGPVVVHGAHGLTALRIWTDAPAAP